MIQLTQEEQNAVNLLGNQAKQVQAQLQQIRDAQMSVIKLLEAKYNAVYDPKMGQLNEKPKVEKSE